MCWYVYVIFAAITGAFLALCVAWVRAIRKSRRLLRVYERATQEEKQWLQQRAQESELGYYMLPVPWPQAVVPLAVVVVLLVLKATGRI